ncbi:MAG: cupin-like domain-containing protein, partial [Cyanobacteria bacterium]|nr:cupin-like domain-containing protein [Cyanobacteriota bacterium]
MPPSTPNPLPPLDTCPPHWQQWIMENLLEGVPPESILAVLEEHLPLENLPASHAPQWLHAIQHHPLYLGTHPLQFQALKQKALLGIYHDLDQETLIQKDTGIHRLANISAEKFLTHYYSTNRPVILEKALSDWPLFHTWTLEAFKKNYGDIPVSVQLERNKHPQAYQRQFDDFCRTIPLKDFIEKIEETPHSNDFYLAAKNQVFQTTALKEALKDVGTLPSFLDPSPQRLEAESYLWMGPGGTQTDLHHDWMNALIIQV